MRIVPSQIDSNADILNIPDTDSPPDYKTCTFDMNPMPQSDAIGLAEDANDFVPEYPFFEKVN